MNAKISCKGLAGEKESEGERETDRGRVIERQKETTEDKIQSTQLLLGTVVVETSSLCANDNL